MTGVLPPNLTAGQLVWELRQAMPSRFEGTDDSAYRELAVSLDADGIFDRLSDGDRRAVVSVSMHVMGLCPDNFESAIGSFADYVETGEGWSEKLDDVPATASAVRRFGAIAVMVP